MPEEVEIEETNDETSDEKASKPVKPESAPRVMGRLVGWSLALPAAAVTWLVAVAVGEVTAATAIGRALAVGIVVHILASVATRILFHSVLAQWRKARKQPLEEEPA